MGEGESRGVVILMAMTPTEVKKCLEKQVGEARAEGSTGDAYWGWVVTEAISPLPQGEKVVHIANRDAANSLDYYIETMAHSLQPEDARHLEVAETPLAAGATAKCVLSEPLHNIIVYTKSTVAGFPASFGLYFRGVK